MTIFLSVFLVFVICLPVGLTIALFPYLCSGLLAFLPGMVKSECVLTGRVKSFQLQFDIPNTNYYSSVSFQTTAVECDDACVIFCAV